MSQDDRMDFLCKSLEKVTPGWHFEIKHHCSSGELELAGMIGDWTGFAIVPYSVLLKKDITVGASNALGSAVEDIQGDFRKQLARRYAEDSDFREGRAFTKVIRESPPGDASRKKEKESVRSLRLLPLPVPVTPRHCGICGERIVLGKWDCGTCGSIHRGAPRWCRERMGRKTRMWWWGFADWFFRTGLN